MLFSNPIYIVSIVYYNLFRVLFSQINGNIAVNFITNNTAKDKILATLLLSYNIETGYIISEMYKLMVFSSSFH